MIESRLQRWSRRKAEVSKKAEPSPSLPVENEPSPEEQELAINQALPEHEVLAKYGLPEPDAIKLGTDITGFMRKEIPELLRRKALRALWKSNPVLAVLDGLNDYDEDFTDAAHAGEVVKTLYKVGQGMFDKAAKRAEREREDEQIEARAGIAEPVESPEPEEPTTVIESSELDNTVEFSSPTRQPEAASTEQETEPAPLYRPRMRFN
ncbi:DUF3306 domain-containing protein [Marinobacter sp.]|uniref:DUF3306 domain-containing protein n=1 Tax=Marinobacter sp. TaxID=50741 RepID=UPI0019DA49F0|nr:DUF3306 domain-containing protein [Marinobacter sp.]MBE0486369.1 DUF3306 domain-containing protein [Marinobacter sp.]